MNLELFRILRLAYNYFILKTFQDGEPQIPQNLMKMLTL